MENSHAWPGKAHCLATFPPTSAKVRWLGKTAFPCSREIHHVYPKICSTESKTFIWGVNLVLVCLTRRKSIHMGDWYIQVGVSDLNPMEPVPQIYPGASCSFQSCNLPSSNHSRSSISLFWPVHCSSSPQMIVSWSPDHPFPISPNSSSFGDHIPFHNANVQTPFPLFLLPRYHLLGNSLSVVYICMMLKSCSSPTACSHPSCSTGPRHLSVPKAAHVPPFCC